MSNQPYIGQDILDQAAEALRQGKKLEALAGILKCSPEHLANLLGIAAAPKPVPANDEFDLWAVEALNAVL
jgi:hypothetical protein